MGRSTCKTEKDNLCYSEQVIKIDKSYKLFYISTQKSLFDIKTFYYIYE